MKKQIKKYFRHEVARGFVFVLNVLLFLNAANAQYTSDKVVGKKNAAMIDSLKNMDYPYMLPIWGAKVVKKGFNIPYPAGLSTQYLWQKSDIIISNLKVGFNGGEQYPLDEIVRLDNATTTTNGVNIRPDIWLFPFLNVYAILAKSKTSTAINGGIWVPDSSGSKKILDLNTKANFEATTFGFGLTPTIGVGGFFLAIDMNFSWTDIPELAKPAYVFVFGPRLGKNIAFKKKDRNIAIWVGGFRVKLDNGTTGSINLSEVLPVDQWGSKIDSGMMRVASSQQKVDVWWEGLSPTEQKNPVNIAKHDRANSILMKAGNVMNAASDAITSAGNSTVQYSLDKRPKDMWNFIVGTQFQINKNWMIRAEYGFLGSRQQFIGGLQWRFGF